MKEEEGKREKERGRTKLVFFKSEAAKWGS
jgi:hypothetical protein